MIRRIEIIFRKTGVWARHGTYPVVPIVPYRDGEVLWSKEYPKETPITEIWGNIRDNMIGFFFDIFYPAVIWQTVISDTPVKHYEPRITPDGRRVWITRQLDKKQTRLPEFYEWDPDFRKWHMTADGYLSRTTELGGGMDISVAETPFERMYDYSLLEDLQTRHPGETLTITLFIYPDRYDEIVRALFDIRVTFW